MGRDIDRELEEIIIKYKIDRFHPRYSKRKEALRYLGEYFRDYGKDKMILVSACDTDSLYIQEDLCLKHVDVINYNQVTPEILKDIKTTYKRAVVISYYSRKEIISHLASCGIQAISIYDYLETRGLFLEGNYYDIFGEQYHEFSDGKATYDYKHIDMNAIFFCDRRGYEVSGEKVVKEMYLTKMIFDCVYTKNFMLAERYIQEYSSKKFPYEKEYSQFQSEVRLLLESIQQRLSKRHKEDMIIFWLDALEYGEDKDMPFLSSMAGASIDFENAYTVTPYTNPTARTLFAGERTVDDRAFKRNISSESSFIKNIQNKGYTFKFYTYLKQIDESVETCTTQNIYTPLSEVCWNAISDMLQAPSKICAVIHEFPHTHSPYISFGLTGEGYSFKEAVGEILDSHEAEVREGQIIESRKYADDILAFYNKLLPAKVYKVFMSDHGHTVFDKYHTIFRVAQKDIKPRKIKRVFSYINFERLILLLLDKKQDFSCALSDYAIVQDVDYYNEKYLKVLLSMKTFDLYGMFGYQGIITEKDRYIRYNDGRVEYMNTRSGGGRLTQEREEYLRNICPSYPEDMIEEEKFRYSRNVYRTFKNYYSRNGDFEKKKRQAVRELFDTVPQGSIIAVRGGGEHTVQLWFTLDWPQREKIHYIIDTNRECIASRLGAEVIAPEDIEKKDIDTVVISSMDFEEAWYQDLKKQGIGAHIIRLYHYLRDKGIICSKAFYWEEFLARDAVWEE